MADKFPALDDIELTLPTEGGVVEDDGDFLAREQELLGDEFKTEADKPESEEEDEFSEFKEQFPEVSEKNGQDEESSEVNGGEPVEDKQFEGFNGSNPLGSGKFEGQSSHLKDWQERRELEISTREKANQAKKKTIVEGAQQSIDDFYDNYNTKKDQHAKEVLTEQEEYLAKRDGFLKRGTFWDRVDELVSEVGDVETGTRDKTRFKELLTKLKGKENVPGAGGYA